MKKKKFKVKTESGGGWTGKHEGYYCSWMSENGTGIIGRLCNRKQDARRSFFRLANRIGVPSDNYEFVESL
jgi:hypothetical protein